jgi:hypothetical protein
MVTEQVVHHIAGLANVGVLYFANSYPVREGSSIKSPGDVNQISLYSL